MAEIFSPPHDMVPSSISTSGSDTWRDGWLRDASLAKAGGRRGLRHYRRSKAALIASGVQEAISKAPRSLSSLATMQPCLAEEVKFHFHIKLRSVVHSSGPLHADFIYQG